MKRMSLIINNHYLISDYLNLSRGREIENNFRRYYCNMLLFIVYSTDLPIEKYKGSHHRYTEYVILKDKSQFRFEKQKLFSYDEIHSKCSMSLEKYMHMCNYHNKTNRMFLVPHKVSLCYFVFKLPSHIHLHHPHHYQPWLQVTTVLISIKLVQYCLGELT